MKWYLASRTRHTDKMLQIAEYLKLQNQEITSTWIYVKENLKPFTENLKRVQEIAYENVNGLLDTEVFVKFNDLDGTDTFSEFGVCLGKLARGENIRVYIVGEYEKTTILQLHPKVIHAKGLQEVFELEKINYTDFVFPIVE